MGGVQRLMIEASNVGDLGMQMPLRMTVNPPKTAANAPRQSVQSSNIGCKEPKNM